jgi:hypothetical protein
MGHGEQLERVDDGVAPRREDLLVRGVVPRGFLRRRGVVVVEGIVGVVAVVVVTVVVVMVVVAVVGPCIWHDHGHCSRPDNAFVPTLPVVGVVCDGPIGLVHG